jgi:plastocyanin
MRTAGTAVLAIAMALALVACSASSAPTVPATAAPAASGAAGSVVTIADFAFAPTAITVAIGTTVTWTNSDTAGHTVTADDGSFGSDRLGTGATFSQTFARAGTFAYHCSIHASMKGTVTVH